MTLEYTKLDLDKLKEIVNIGAGNAGTALAHMLGRKIGMTVPDVMVGSVNTVQDKIVTKDEVVVGIFLKMTGEIGGAMALIFKPDSAKYFIDILTGNKVTSIKVLKDTEKSALLEVGNILLGSSITALSKFMELKISHSIPDIAIDMFGAITDTMLLDISKGREDILAFRIELGFEDHSTTGDLYYLLDPGSSKHFLELIKEKFN